MKALILYQPVSEHARAVEEFVRDFTRRTNKPLELIDSDSVEGVSKVELYDIVQYPTVLVTKDDGGFVKSWLGLPLPLVNDVDGYLVEQ